MHDKPLFEDQKAWKREANDKLEEQYVLTAKSCGVGHGVVLAQAPTGFGKTHTFCEMVEEAVDLGHHVCVRVPSRELIDQVSEPFLERGIRHGFITGGKDYPELPGEQVQIATPLALLNKWDRYGKPKFTLAINDECHGDLAETNRRLNARLRDSGCLYRLGVTATPCRLDGAGLKLEYPAIVLGPQKRTLIDSGRLAQPLVYGAPVIAEIDKLEKSGPDYSKRSLDAVLNTKKVNANAVEMYETLPGVLGTQALVCCASVDHCYKVETEFFAAGYSTGVLEGNMKPFERKQMVKAFRDKTIQILFACELAIQGFDVPAVQTLIDIRKTMSLRIYEQMRGRVMRGDGGRKRECYIIDLVANTYRFGMPDADREWTLEGGSGATTYKSKLRQCPGCYLWCRVGQDACRCGREFKAEAKQYKTEKNGCLVLIEGVKTSMKARSKLDDYKDEEKLIKRDDPQCLEKIKALVAKYAYAPKFARVRYRMKTGAAWKNQWAKKKKEA